MNLDDFDLIKKLDPEGVLEEIRSIPDQINIAWEAKISSESLDLAGVTTTLIGSAGTTNIAARLIQKWSIGSSWPILTIDNPDLPCWRENQRVMLVLLGATGDEKVLIREFDQGIKLGYRMFVFARGGKLIEMAKARGIPFYESNYSGSWRTSYVWEFFYLLGKFHRSGCYLSSGAEISHITDSLLKIREKLDVNELAVNNPAKRLAGQILNRFVTLFASGFMEPVAEHWKRQINDYAKAWAQVENIPRACFSTVSGMYQPENLLSQMMTIFLQSNCDDPSDRLLSDEMRRMFMVEGFNTDLFLAEGHTPGISIWNALYFGEFVSYYLAMAYGVNPADNPGFEEMADILSQM